MPVTPNTLLQATPQAKPQAAVNSPAAAPEFGNKASSFAQVFARHIAQINVFQIKAGYTAQLVARTLHYNAELRMDFFWRRIAKIEYGVNSHFL